MLIVMEVENEQVPDMFERCKSLAAVHRGLSELYKNPASKAEALKKARMYEVMFKGIESAMRIVPTNDQVKRELKSLADKYGPPPVIEIINQYFEDEGSQPAKLKEGKT